MRDGKAEHRRNGGLPVDRGNCRLDFRIINRHVVAA
jgi:hypothetical protein